MERDALYAKYAERQDRDVAAIRRDEAEVLPDDLDYGAMSGLSGELRAKLSAARPDTLGQAARVEGMTPAALTLILAKVRQAQKMRA